VSEKLFSRVTKYHAQIGGQVKKETLNQLEWNLLTEAKEQFHRAQYEEALNTFTACLAVTEKTRNSKDFAVRGAIVHNIASCLHHLGEIEAAQEYYEQAISSFEKANTGVVEKLLYGDTNKRRVDFVKERLIDISWGRKPDIDKYLDENGRKRPVPVPPPAFASQDQKLSDKWGDEPPPPPWAARDMDAVNSDYPYDRRPAWMSATRRGGGGGAYATVNAAGPSSYAKPDSPPPARGDVADEPDDATQEQARREWLQFYLQTSDWHRAEELVVTADEREDLEYLRDRERRLGPARAGEVEEEARAPAPAAESYSSSQATEGLLIQ
jgi:tetratricopeptide (TPR) repeat protein